MKPRWHVILGVVFSLLVWMIFDISLLEMALIFLASVFIDIDHYLIYFYHKRKFGVNGFLRYYDELCSKELRGVREGKKWKSHIQVFHTIEFHLLILITAFYFNEMYFILIGMVFHSILDVVWLWRYKMLSFRYFFFFQWMFVKKNSRVHNKYYK